MGIAARTHQFAIEGTSLEIVKVMASNPRRVSEIRIKFFMPQGHYDDKRRSILNLAARTCPVALSLHPDLIQTVNFHYPEDEL